MLKTKGNKIKLIEKIWQIIFVSVMVFFATGTITNTEADSNSKNEKLFIMERMSYWVAYWVNYYRLDKGMIDPNLKEKVTKQLIEKYEYRLINHESQWIPKSRSWEKNLKCYSYGLTRLLPQTARDEGWNFKNEEELYDINNNLKYGIKYFCKKIKLCNGNIKHGIASFNAGGVYYIKYAKDSNVVDFINQGYVNAVYFNKRKIKDIKFQKTSI